jgi:hypothetical protein
MLADAISSWLQLIVLSEITVLSHLAWCFFGKLCLLSSLLILFDDRWRLISQYLGVSLVFLTVQSIVQRKIVLSDEIKAGDGVLSWVHAYVKLFLDLPFQLACVFNLTTPDRS